MKKIFYEKVGKRYVPVSEYNDELLDSRKYGDYLISVRPGCTSTIKVVDPAFAPMVAAGLYARQSIEEALLESSKFSPSREPITAEQQEAWKRLSDSFGEQSSTLQKKSIHEIAQTGIDEMQKQANLLLTNDSVKIAFNNFLLVSKLTQETKERNHV
jgi:hypothetical protein